MEKVRPKVEVKSRRVGGATYQVPMEVSQTRRNALAIRWIINYSKSRSGKSMSEKLAAELMDAFNNRGSAVKKRMIHIGWQRPIRPLLIIVGKGYDSVYSMGAERLPFRATLLRERELSLALYDRVVDCDWTSGSFMLAQARGARVRGLPRRALLHLQRGARPLPAHQARRLEGVPPPGDDDRPLRGEGRDSSEDVGSGRLHANAARAKAFLAPPPRLVRGRAGTRLRGASADAGAAILSGPGAATRHALPSECSSAPRVRLSASLRGRQSARGGVVRRRSSRFREPGSGRAWARFAGRASSRRPLRVTLRVILGATHCRFCDAPLALTVIDLGKSPLCESFLAADQLETMEPFYPLHVRTCSQCWLAQLPAFVAPTEIFSEYAYFSGFSDSWIEHARGYVEMISERLSLTTESLVVELASNDGYLLQHFLPKGIPVLGVDPAANVARAAEERGVPTLVEFFGADVAGGWRVRAAGRISWSGTTFSHRCRISMISSRESRSCSRRAAPRRSNSPPGPALEGLQYDTIYHEHFSYFSLFTIREVLAAHGLAVVDVEELPTHGGSLRVYAAHENDPHRPTRLPTSSSARSQRAFGTGSYR